MFPCFTHFLVKYAKIYTRLLVRAVLKCICRVLNFKDWDYSQKVSAGHKQSGTLKDSALKIPHKNASFMHSLEQVITVATIN